MNRPLPSSSSTSTTSTLSAQAPTRRKSRSPNSTTTTTSNGLPASRLPPAPKKTASSTTAPGWGVQWSKLEGLANSVLGVDPEPERTLKHRRQTKPLDSRNAAPSSSSSSWFSSPEPPTDRGSMRPRGRRRADMPNGSASQPPSSRRNNYKRATSPDPDDDEIEVGDLEGEREILVYVHHVRPTDTVEGVVIAFNIPPGTLRKANGMWSHDSVQSRRTLLLPVDECAVKGKPVDPLDADESNGKAKQPQKPNAEGTESTPAEEDQEKPYKHESYVLIPGIGQVEIARLARKKLSHFPPRRRKSTSARRISSLGDLPSTPSLLDDPPLLDLLEEPTSPTNVFHGMTPGVGELHPQNNIQNNQAKVGPGVAIGPDTFTLRALGEIANDTVAGMENIGGVVEGFVRKWTTKAQGFVGGDLIELTQRLGFEIDENGRGGEAMRRGGSMESSGSNNSRRGARMDRTGSGSGRDRGGRVVRERLTRRDGEGDGNRERERVKVL